MPFLRLTRDRRGFENTFLMHADRHGDRPRLLYWYRTAPGITLGRSPLDEDAIRAIEDQHPDIDFDWPAILALSEVMTPEDEAPARPQQREQRQGQGKRRGRDREPGSESQQPRQPRREAGAPDTQAAVESTIDVPDAIVSEEALAAPPPSLRPSGLVEQLAGREIAARLRSRYDEIVSRIKDADESSRASLLQRAEAMDPDQWDSPEAVLKGVTNADTLFEELRASIGS